MFEHYFIDKEHKKEDYFNFKYVFNNKTYNFTSVDNVFSKNTVDYGSLVLINSVIKNYDLNNKKCLDLGSGVGVIGIFLKDYFKNADFTLSDITKSASKLSERNAKQNNIEVKVVNSNLFENLNENFDFIITNPPIKSGKKLLFSLVEESFKHLNIDGRLVLVIRKNHGEESLKKHIESIFENCEILKRDSGYYILSAIK